MSGFMSSSTALMVCKADSPTSLALDALRQHAFTPEIDADGRRFGWVGLGDPLDADGFELASVDARFMGFSFADPDRQLEFTLDAGLAVSGLKLPKAEKGAEEDATFLVNADVCAAVADMVEGVAATR